MNLFVRQIKDRERADEAMKMDADKLIEECVSSGEFSGKGIDFVRTNDSALDLILSKCNLTRYELDNIEKKDVLFTCVEDTPKWYKLQAGYCVGKDAEGNYYALMPGIISGYYYIDENGKRIRIKKQNVSKFVKVYCLCEILPDKVYTAGSFFKYLMSFMRFKTYVLYVLLAIISGGLGLVFPYMVSYLMRNVGEDSSISLALGVAGLCICMELIRTIINIALRLFESSYTNMVAFSVKNSVLLRYLTSHDDQEEEMNSSNIWSLINNDLPSFTENLLGAGINIIPRLVFTICYFFAAIIVLRRYSLLLLFILIVGSAVIWFINLKHDRWSNSTLVNRRKGDDLLHHIFKGMEKVRSRKAERRIYLRWAKRYSKEAISDKLEKKYNAMDLASHDFVLPILTLLLIIVAKNSSMTYSMFLTGTVIAGLLVPQLIELVKYSEKIININTLWDSIAFFLEKEPNVEKKPICRDFDGTLQVQNLAFTYPGMQRFLDDISLDIEAGEYVGITGLSGCGKSTLLNLILGILEPTAGMISYGKYNLELTDQRSILKNIGIVLQGETLIPGTIRQNMMMQPRPVTEEMIWETLEKVGIADLIRSYPYGLDTELGMLGDCMSGGQMQKLLIARAIVSKPKMVIFDEATNALDNVSQREIKNILDSMGCTRIVVAHRLSTIKDCDKIFVLDDGKICQQGTYDDLIEQDGLFRNLVLCHEENE